MMVAHGVIGPRGSVEGKQMDINLRIGSVSRFLRDTNVGSSHHSLMGPQPELARRRGFADLS